MIKWLTGGAALTGVILLGCGVFVTLFIHSGKSRAEQRVQFQVIIESGSLETVRVHNMDTWRNAIMLKNGYKVIAIEPAIEGKIYIYEKQEQQPAEEE